MSFANEDEGNDGQSTPPSSSMPASPKGVSRPSRAPLIRDLPFFPTWAECATVPPPPGSLLEDQKKTRRDVSWIRGFQGCPFNVDCMEASI